MAAMSRNNSVSALQGFSVCQPLLGAPLQWYPALGTPQLDELINAHVPGTASVKEKRAIVSMDFFEYSQLTGKTFKYYLTQPSSAEPSPLQDSSYMSDFVSPVISDWSWSQSTPGSASVSTPASVTQDAAVTKPSKRTVAHAKSQRSDFSHIPGMKIMTKDGRDVTNSASRGCKTKEQRDHAHLMRIIKACDACKKKKVRCDPSHKKRPVAQSHPAAPFRLAKKATTTSTAKDQRTIAERQPQQNASSSYLFTEPVYTGLEIPDISFGLAESWESFVRFDDETLNTAPFEYDFFFDPEGHLSPESSQSPETSSMAFSQPLAAVEFPENSQPFVEEATARQPTLPYMDANAPANDYVDFNLYSPESSFLNEDAGLVTGIGTTSCREHIAATQCYGLAEGCQSSYSRTDARTLSSTDSPTQDHLPPSSPQLLDDPQDVDRRHRLLSHGGRRSIFAGDQGVSQNATSYSTDDPLTRVLNSPLMTSAVQKRISSQFSAKDVARTRQPQGSSSQSPNAGDSSFGASPAQPSSSQVPLTSATSFARFSASLGEPSYYAATNTTSSGDGKSGVIGASGTATSTWSLLATGVKPSVSRGTSTPLRSQSSVIEVVGSFEIHFAMAALASDSIVFARRALASESSTMQLLFFTALLVATLGIAASILEAQVSTSGLLRIAFGRAMYKACSHSSLKQGPRLQQSRLSSTFEPRGLSKGARLPSSVSTRLRHTRRQNQDAYSRSRPVVASRVLGFAQGLP